MSKPIPFYCPVPTCRFYTKPIIAEKIRIKKHIYHDHDYQELLEASVQSRIIKDLYERRSPDYLSEQLAEVGIRRAEHEIAMY
ncbi:MAG: hypothetical protein LDL06_04375 [Candidatus Nitrosotenuis sp.]|nr:hypothetical protein [Candidatus Nitrosotenuis sp.]